MAKVMLRESADEIFFYIAKKDMEETIVSIEFNDDEKWGGRVELSNAEIWWIEPSPKNLPRETICKRITD